MYRSNPLKARLAAGRPSLGLWLVGNDPLTAEVAGSAGYDFVIIDHEHGPGDLVGAIRQMQALWAAAGRDHAPATLIRVAVNDTAIIKRALDTGAEGIVIPMIESAEAARAAIAACKYPPDGVRGCALGATRATGFGASSAEYWRGINDDVLVVLQIETPAAVEAIAEIAAVPGGDVLFVGPNDLSVSAGHDPLDRPPEAWALIGRAAAAIRATGKPVATVLTAGRTPQAMFDEGYAMITGGSEMSLLRRAMLAQTGPHRAADG